jgi:hypothetical protein
MKLFRSIPVLCAFLLFCLVSVPSLQAQKSQPPSPSAQSIDPARLPKNTIFYVLWRGAPVPAARSANSLYALWDDPGFAPARNALLDSFVSDQKSGDVKSKFTREEISEYTDLLENPMAIGFVSDPENKPKSVSLQASGAPGSAAAKPESAHKWNGFYFIYDRTGKEALLAKALLRFRAQEKTPSKISPITIAGIPAQKIERKSGETDYWVENGKYVITSGELSVVQQLLTRFNSGAPSQSSLISSDQAAELEKIVARTTPGAPAMSLGGIPAFKEANPVLGNGGILEFFVNISDVIKLAGDAPGPQGIRPSMILDSLKMSSVHSFSGRVFLDGSKTRFQAGVLGEAAPGTIFDIWDAGQEKPASTAYITSNAVSYRETQLNLPALYALALRVATPFFPKGQADPSNMMEAAAQIKLGMTTTEALNSLTGEFGYLQTDSSLDLGKNTFFVGVHNRNNVLKLLRRAFIDEISADTDEKGTTFLTLDFSKPAEGQKPTAGNKFYLAVAKDMILVTSNRETLRAPLAQSAASATATPLTSFLSSHNDGHAMLNGLSFTDFQKFDWQSLKNLPGRNKATGASVLLGFAPDKAAPAQEKSWLDEIDPKVFSRHLHLSLGYTWKDEHGLHIDGWID